jgi:hypothetical protein
MRQDLAVRVGHHRVGEEVAHRRAERGIVGFQKVAERVVLQKVV